MPKVQLSYYSDVLCIWAYIAERRLRELVETFGERISIDVCYCSVFPDAWGKIEQKWSESGGFAGFNRHLREVAEKFPHIEVNERLWLDSRPRTSASAHLFLKAVEAVEQSRRGVPPADIPYLDRLSTQAAWSLRRAFFASAKDVSDWRIHEEISDEIGVDFRTVEEKIRSSEAVLRLATDYERSQSQKVEGSPTFIMNNGRQKLFGNIGYRLLEANVQELLRNPRADEASWC
jgi:predicted DsbA family dithiol-disulfide isomerase